MKKLLFWAVGLLSLLTACQQEELPGMENGSSQTITVSIPEGVQTKATAAEFGQGAHINRCILQVYHNSKPHKRLVAAVTDKKATFNLRLVTSQTYDFVFWADCATGTAPNDFGDNHYNTTDLQAIKVQGTYSGNNDEFDAFTAAEKGYTVKGAFTKNITLKRPFGQLNVSTKDLGTIQDESLKPNKIKVDFKSVPTTFNAWSGTVGNSQKLSYETALSDPTNGALTVDYLFASEKEGATLVDFTMTFFNGETEITQNEGFTNIPIRRNYRTNVSGNLLTKQGTLNVTVDAAFENTNITQEMVEVATTDQIDEALQQGATNVVVTTAPTTQATITIPKIYDANNTTEISITLPATTAEMTIGYDNQNKTAPAEVHLTAPSMDHLVINLPNSTVTLNGETYTNVTATTAANTLIVPEGVTIEHLTIKGGNVKLYGIVNTLTKDNGYTGTIYRCIGSQASFNNLVNDTASGYTQILVENCTTTIDGGNATLTKPMTISSNVTLKNLRMAVPKEGGADNSKLYGGYGCCAILIIDGADNAILENIVSSNAPDIRTCLLSGNTAGVTARNCIFIVPKEAYKAGFNLHCMSKESTITANFENCLIGISETKLNVDKSNDYDYTSEMTTAAGIQTRGISIGADGGNTTALEGKVNLNMTKTVAEGISYVINTEGRNVFVNAHIEDCILDGRAALNLRGHSGGNYLVKNSKLIGRNWFPGSTENFATIVYNYASSEPNWACENQVVTLEGTEIIAYSKPQTDTNWQYLADLRSPFKNTLKLLNGSKFREIHTPRLDYLVDVEDPEVSEVIWDETFVIEGKEGATVLPAWDGKTTEVVTPNSEGVYEITQAAQLAWIAAEVNSGKTFEGETIRLMSDINLYNRSWTPIGNGHRQGAEPVGNQFKGTFDGNHKTVSAYTIYNTGGNKDNALGLFGIVNGGTVKDFIIKKVDVYNDSEMAAAAVGMLTGGGTVSGVEVASGTVEVTRGNGGIVGRLTKSGTISSCINRATILGKGANVGGIVGAAYYTTKDQTMKIENCTNYGTVTGQAGAVGGIAGLSAATVTGCVNEAAITGNGADVAGIVAEQQNAGSITKCINRGNITNQSQAYGTGGIVGWIRYNGATANYPVKNVIHVTENENYGNVQGGNDAGGIVGTVYNLGVINKNKNNAKSLKGTTFAAGIVGNAQFTEKPVGMTEENRVEVKNNQSTTPLTSITAQNKDPYVYINQQDAVIAEGNTGAQ